MAMSKAEKIPQEIIVDILHRLPAKSVGQFRCVSKLWCSLLSDPQFIKAHLTSHSNQEQEKLIIISESLSLHTITFTQNGNDCISRKLSFQQLSDNWITVHGSCNGLVLVGNDERLNFLINPTTLEYYEIPRFDMALPVPGSFSMFGLGYDVVSDDYKVVTLSYYDTDNEYEPDIDYTFVDVYSVRKGIWRRLESSPYDHAVPELASGVLVNGALHWLASKRTSGYSSVIVAFDLSDEKFLEAPAPTTLDKDSFVFNKLVSLSGCLCMFTNTFDVWMMKDYGVEESWTKLAVEAPKSLDDPIPLLLMSEDDIVVDADGELIVYNMREDRWRNMTDDGFPKMCEHAGTRTFRETLVSPTFD